MHGQIEKIGPSTLKRLQMQSPQEGRSLTVAPDGRLLAVSVNAGAGSSGARVVLLDFERDLEIRHLQDPEPTPGKSHEGGRIDLEFSPDGSLLVSASTDDRDRMVKIWEVGSGRLLTKFPASGSGFLDTAFTPNGRFLALTTATGARLYELGGILVQTTMAHQAFPISAMALDGLGRNMVCASVSRSLLDVIGDTDVTAWETINSSIQRRFRSVVSR